MRQLSSREVFLVFAVITAVGIIMIGAFSLRSLQSESHKFDGPKTAAPVNTAPVNAAPSNAATPRSEISESILNRRMKLTAISRTAESITGDIEFSVDNSILIQGKKYQSKLVRVLAGQDVEDAAQMFSINPPAPDTAAARGLQRIDIPLTDKFLNGNTLCGTADVKWVLYMQGDENQDIWNLAFFSGDAEPDFRSLATLCGTFRYESPPGK